MVCDTHLQNGEFSKETSSPMHMTGVWSQASHSEKKNLQIFLIVMKHQKLKCEISSARFWHGGWIRFRIPL